MIGNYLGYRLFSLVPIALVAILLVIIGPERLQHLQAKERWGILGCLLLAFVVSSVPRRYFGTIRSGASVSMGIQVGHHTDRILPPDVVFHSALAPQAIADTLRRSIDVEGMPRYMVPSFIRLFRQTTTGRFCGVVDSNIFRVKRSNGGQYAPNFYGRWEPEYGGTRIVGFFELAPLVKLSLRIFLIVMLVLWCSGIVANVLDLYAGTHFTRDPEIGLPVCAVFIVFTLGFYFVVRKLGSRPDESLLAFLEQTLAASRVG
ncbi:MAG: hypothetical protein ABSG34_18975 [Candidatus Sulfotelmatobacter sp.]|jgi:hypothetical protein